MSFHDMNYLVLDGVPTPENCLGNQTVDSVLRNIAGDKYIVKIAGELPMHLEGIPPSSHFEIKELLQSAEWLA